MLVLRTSRVNAVTALDVDSPTASTPRSRRPVPEWTPADPGRTVESRQRRSPVIGWKMPGRCTIGKLDMKTSRREWEPEVLDLPPHAAEVAAEVAALADLPAELAVPGTAVEVEIFGEWVPGEVAEEPGVAGA